MLKAVVNSGGGGGGGTPGGSNGQFQYNNAGSFGGVTLTGALYRIRSNISTTTTAGAAANTDYVYFCTGTFTFTLPSASGNNNRYSVKNMGTGVITVVGTVDGVVNPTLSSQYEGFDVMSNDTAWGSF